MATSMHWRVAVLAASVELACSDGGLIDTGGTISSAEFPSAASNKLDEIATSCQCRPDGVTVAERRAALQEGYDEAVTAGLEYSTACVDLHLAHLGTCPTEHSDRSCELQGCKAFNGNAQLGEPCMRAALGDSCAPGLMCLDLYIEDVDDVFEWDSITVAECVDPCDARGLGEQCLPEVCAPGLYCTVYDGDSVETVDALCESTEGPVCDPSCGADEWCDWVGCTPRGDVGDLCTDDDSCADGLRCSAAGGECAHSPGAALGEPCSTGSDCASDVCFGGTCRGNGIVCEDDYSFR